MIGLRSLVLCVFVALSSIAQLQAASECTANAVTEVAIPFGQTFIDDHFSLVPNSLKVWAFKICIDQFKTLASCAVKAGDSRRLVGSEPEPLVVKIGLKVGEKELEVSATDEKGCTLFKPKDVFDEFKNVDYKTIKAKIQMSTGVENNSNLQVNVQGKSRDFSDEAITSEAEFPLTLIRDGNCGEGKKCVFLKSGDTPVAAADSTLNYIKSGAIVDVAGGAEKTLIILHRMPADANEVFVTNPDCVLRSPTAAKSVQLADQSWNFEASENFKVGAFRLCIKDYQTHQTCVPPPSPPAASLPFSVSGRRLQDSRNKITVTNPAQAEGKLPVSKQLDLHGCVVITPCDVLDTKVLTDGQLEATVSLLATTAPVLDEPKFGSFSKYQQTITDAEDPLTVWKKNFCNNCQVVGKGTAETYYLKEGKCLAEAQKGEAEATLMVITGFTNGVTLQEDEECVDAKKTLTITPEEWELPDKIGAVKVCPHGLNTITGCGSSPLLRRLVAAEDVKVALTNAADDKTTGPKPLENGCVRFFPCDLLKLELSGKSDLKLEITVANTKQTDLDGATVQPGADFSKVVPCELGTDIQVTPNTAATLIASAYCDKDTCSIAPDSLTGSLEFQYMKGGKCQEGSADLGKEAEKTFIILADVGETSSIKVSKTTTTTKPTTTKPTTTKPTTTKPTTTKPTTTKPTTTKPTTTKPTTTKPTTTKPTTTKPTTTKPTTKSDPEVVDDSGACGLSVVLILCAHLALNFI